METMSDSAWKRNLTNSVQNKYNNLVDIIDLEYTISLIMGHWLFCWAN
jgi:uncharacterized protein HemX